MSSLERGDRVELSLFGRVSLGTVIRELPSGDVLVQLDQGELSYLPPPGQFERKTLRPVTLNASSPAHGSR